MSENLISIKNCSIQSKTKTFIEKIDWSMQTGEAWLIIGPNSGGKDIFLKALSGEYDFVPNNTNNLSNANNLNQNNLNLANPNQTNENQNQSFYYSAFGKDVALVSLENAAHLIQEENERDESEYLNKKDPGRTGRQYICEVLNSSSKIGSSKNALSKKGDALPEIAARLETLPQVKLCGVEKILDRGLKFMSTGEIRRTLLCRSLLSGAKLIILSDPFAGLDAESRKILLEFFTTITNRQINLKKLNFDFPKIILSMERFNEIPTSINKVLEMTNKQISFCGSRELYEKIRNQKLEEKAKTRKQERNAFLEELKKIREESKALTLATSNSATLTSNSATLSSATLTAATLTSSAATLTEKTSTLSENSATLNLSSESSSSENPQSLIKFENVNVGWDEHQVLKNLTWEVKQGVHWLIQGPNGSGKTTILELITGDNMQVFRENIKIFGKRRGSGESIWDIKKQLGIVSYRLHVDYRMLGGTSLLNVIISGFKDSIGLYEKASDFEIATAKAWLKLADFKGRETENFSSLSYGEQRAILILRAAVKNPRILILDEPCHGLDENYREKILDLLETVAQTGTTTLLHVTHDPTEILSCEHNVLELKPNENPMFRIKKI